MPHGSRVLCRLVVVHGWSSCSCLPSYNGMRPSHFVLLRAPDKDADRWEERPTLVRLGYVAQHSGS